MNAGVLAPKRLGLAVVIALVGLVSCDEATSQLRVGLSSSPGGIGIEIRFLTCMSERVVSVALLRKRGELVGDQDDEVLWKIRSSRGSQRSVYRVGATPPGFELIVPVRAESLTPPPLAVKVETTMIPSTTISFDPRDLREGRILVRDGEPVSVADFQAHARRACKG